MSATEIVKQVEKTDWDALKRQADLLVPGRYIKRLHAEDGMFFDYEVVIEVRSGERCYCDAERFKKEDEFWMEVVFALVNGSEFIPIVPVAGESHEPVRNLVNSREQLRDLSCFVCLVGCEFGA